jgi:hypothetical protein
MKPKTPKLTEAQKAQVLGDQIADELAAHVLLAAQNGPLTVPLTAISRNGRFLCGLFGKAKRQECPTKKGVLLFVTF